MQVLLHGGRFDWNNYFEKGALAVMDRKNLKRTQQEKAQFETNALRIGPCIKDWAKERLAVEFIYNYLNDLVHPNKGSNLALLVQREGKALFDITGENRIGMLFFERIFGVSVGLCTGEMINAYEFFSTLGEDERENVAL